MKHLKKGRKLGRMKKQRNAMAKIMLGQLLNKQKIRTTEAKGREIQVAAEKILAQIKRLSKPGKKSNLVTVRKIRAKLPANITADKLPEIAAKINSKDSGFTRLTKISSRRSDGARMAMVEIISD